MLKVASANEFLVITGFGIKEFIITKKKYVWPMQNVNLFTVTPLNYEVSLHAMSHEKLALKIVASLTIGPRESEPKELQKYVRLLVNNENREKQEKMIRERITGIIEGEMRAVAASMAIEEIFNDRRHFQQLVTEYIQEALDKFGCILYNANVEELVDSSRYFEVVGQKAQEGAISSAKVAVAEAQALGKIGQQEKMAYAAKETSRLNAETTVYENERTQTMAQSSTELKVKMTNCQVKVNISKVEADKSAEVREAELQKELEKRRAAVETEKLRGDDFAKAIIQAESMQVLADAAAYEKQALAEAHLYETQQQAEANLCKQAQLAQGIQEVYLAQAEGLKKLITSFEKPQTAINYLMLERNLYQKLAAENAKALEGLAPKLNIWATKDDDPSKPLRDIFQILPPLTSTIENQTNTKGMAI